MSNRQKTRAEISAGKIRRPAAPLLIPAGYRLVFVVNAHGEPGLFMQDEVTSEEAADLLAMMANAIRKDPGWRERGEV